MKENTSGELHWTEKERLLPPIMIFLLLVLSIFSGLLLSFAARMGLDAVYGQSFQEVYSQINEASPSSDRYHVRWALLLSHLLTFVLPGVGVGIFLFRRYWAQYLQLDRMPHLLNLMLGGLLIIAALPLAQFSLWMVLQLTEVLPLPEWARSIEDSTMRIINGLLKTDNLGDLLANLLVIALIPAIGEELVFRGIVQRTFSNIIKKPVVAIWIAALLFSLFHLQLEGLLARLILGALLGYLYYWTSNLWVCIFAHFMNNGMQIIAHYVLAGKTNAVDLNPAQEVSWGMTIFSLILVLLICRTLIRFNQENNREAQPVPNEQL